MQYEQVMLSELREIKTAIKEQGDSSKDIEELKEKVDSIETLLSNLVVDISDIEIPINTWVSISDELYLKLLHACTIITNPDILGVGFLTSADDLKTNVPFEDAIVSIEECTTYRVFGYSVWEDDVLSAYTAIALCQKADEYGLIYLEL